MDRRDGAHTPESTAQPPAATVPEGATAPEAATASIGLPELPLLPALDPTLLLAPLTDLLRTFGTGIFGGTGALDPSTLLAGIGRVIDDGVGLLAGAAKSLDGGWLGQAATAAISTAMRTATEAGAIAAQGAGMAVDLQAAAAIVAAGAVELQVVIAKTAGLLTAALPAIATPPGQIAALAIAAEGLAEGLAVVGATRAQLVAPTATMAKNGTPIPVTGLPGATGATSIGSLLESAMPLVQAGAQLVTSLLSGVSGLAGTTGGQPRTAQQKTTDRGSGRPTACPTTCESDDRAATAARDTAGAGAGGGPKLAAASAVGGPVGGAAVTSAPPSLAACPGTTNAVTGASATSPAAGPQLSTASAGSSVPMVPPASGAMRASVSADTVRPPIVPVSTTESVSAVPDIDAEWLANATPSPELDVVLALARDDAGMAGSV